MFEAILQQFHETEGVESVVFADSEGEIVLSCGESGSDELLLLGAYQGILLASLKRLTSGESGTIVSVYEDKRILTHLLKDGYFISVLLSPEANFARLHFLFQTFYSQLIKEL